jgi:mannosyltransferase OCH1-like enzyme
MVPKIIHQIFLSVNGSKIEDHYLFIKGRKKWINWCKRYGYIYKFHTDENIEKYLNPDELDFWNTLKYKWQKIDFIRYCIINKEGGVYIDLDIYPRQITFHSFDKYIQKNEYLIGVWFDKKNNKLTPSNSILAFKKNKLTSLIKYSMEETEKKNQIEVYATWKKRYMLQTTGVRMFGRWVKKNNLKYSIKLHDYVKDLETATWHSNFG